MSTATVPNSIKSLRRLKGSVASVTRFTDNKTFVGRILLEDDNDTLRILTNRRGRPARFSKRLVSSITLVETEAAQEMAQELASAG